ncbi:DUF429 domain-containing protein [Salinarimonas ramus]|uniref:DUF429 domain-containing protein n=1 Tax=Salinarimonas ramus TaxID=690164 RepID=A0A917QII6_9HYPH|nr:DUF429 domain-containing protein [Salinarimonas ramus]GGK52914.1 hypothetical protein GCM10011322_44760 [Salinarimonas ramus]
MASGEARETASPWIAGADGYPFGWVVAFMRLDGAEPPRLRGAPDLAAVLDAPEAPRLVAIDMPIGLPERIVGPGRAAEQAVRPLLGGRQSSVFSMPSRAAVYAADYREACGVALATSTPPRKVSKQGFMLFPKIREIDALLRARPQDVARVFEVHPEVAFWRMNGERALETPKKVKGRAHPPGLAQRRALLEAAGIPAALVDAERPRGSGPDDHLDALAALVVAMRLAQRTARGFPEPPERDAHGLPVAIWA